MFLISEISINSFRQNDSIEIHEHVFSIFLQTAKQSINIFFSLLNLLNNNLSGPLVTAVF